MASRSISSDQIAQARRMVKDGVPFNEIAAQFGCSAQTIQRNTVAAYKEKCEQYAARRKAKRDDRKRSKAGKDNPGGGGASGVRTYAVSKEDIAARLAEIPADTRTPAQRAMGDPLPGRSALDRMTRPV